MKLSSALVFAIIVIVFFSACQKPSNISIPEVNLKQLKLGQYKGTFAECGLTACYTKDTTFQLTIENEKYFLIMGNRKAEIELSYNAREFTSMEVIFDTTNNTGNYLFSGWFVGDSSYVKFTDDWGIMNNNLLAGKKQK